MRLLKKFVELNIHKKKKKGAFCLIAVWGEAKYVNARTLRASLESKDIYCNLGMISLKYWNQSVPCLPYLICIKD